MNFEIIAAQSHSSPRMAALESKRLHPSSPFRSSPPPSYTSYPSQMVVSHHKPSIYSHLRTESTRILCLFDPRVLLLVSVQLLQRFRVIIANGARVPFGVPMMGQMAGQCGSGFQSLATVFTPARTPIKNLKKLNCEKRQTRLGKCRPTSTQAYASK